MITDNVKLKFAVIEDLPPEIIDIVRSDAPPLGGMWIGPMYAYDRFELIPFHFGMLPFLSAFFHPSVQIGDINNGDDILDAYSDGYVPSGTARIIKFARLDATSSHYDTGWWKLDIPAQIFQFGEQLGEVVAAHARSEFVANEYFYWPSDNRLKRFYERIKRKISEACPELDYAHILEPTGEFHGYRKNS